MDKAKGDKPNFKPSASSYKNFHNWLLVKICEKGGTRMQVSCAELTKEMQALDNLDDINLFRK